MRPTPAALRFQAAPNAVRVVGSSPRHASAPTPAVGFVPESYPAARLFAALLLLPRLSPIRAPQRRDAPSLPATASSTSANARSIRPPRDPGLLQAYFRSPPATALELLPIHWQSARARTIAQTRAPQLPVAESHWR